MHEKSFDTFRFGPGISDQDEIAIYAAYFYLQITPITT